MPLVETFSHLWMQPSETWETVFQEWKAFMSSVVFSFQGMAWDNKDRKTTWNVWEKKRYCWRCFMAGDQSFSWPSFYMSKWHAQLHMSLLDLQQHKHCMSSFSIFCHCSFTWELLFSFEAEMSTWDPSCANRDSQYWYSIFNIMYKGAWTWQMLSLKSEQFTLLFLV